MSLSNLFGPIPNAQECGILLEQRRKERIVVENNDDGGGGHDGHQRISSSFLCPSRNIQEFIQLEMQDLFFVLVLLLAMHSKTLDEAPSRGKMLKQIFLCNLLHPIIGHAINSFCNHDFMIFFFFFLFSGLSQYKFNWFDLASIQLIIFLQFCCVCLLL